MFDISRVLNASIIYFFDDMEDGSAEAVVSDDAAIGSPELLTKRETLELVRAYYKIAVPVIRVSTFAIGLRPFARRWKCFTLVPLTIMRKIATRAAIIIWRTNRLWRDNIRATRKTIEIKG